MHEREAQSFSGLRLGDKVTFDPGFWHRPWYVRACKWLKFDLIGRKEPPKVLTITSIVQGEMTIQPAILPLPPDDDAR